MDARGGNVRIVRRIACRTLIAAGVALAAGDVPAQSPQGYPTKPVRIVVGFSAGSATDISARMIAPRLSERWGQPVVIENRSGAGGTLAAAAVAKATPDGHTLLLISASFAITAVLQPKLPYDALKDFTGVTQIGTTTGMLAVPPALGVKSVKELIALAKARPNQILFGSAGSGSGIHMTAERFKMLAGIDTVHVAFRGQPEMLLDILAGRVHYGFPSLGTALTFVREGRLLALAVVTTKRSPLLPEVPTMVEVLPGFERDAAHALMAPAGTPRPILAKISKDVAAVLDLPEVRRQMLAMSFDPAPSTPEEFDRILRKQLEIFASVAKTAGLLAP